MIKSIIKLCNIPQKFQWLTIHLFPHQPSYIVPPMHSCCSRKTFRLPGMRFCCCRKTFRAPGSTIDCTTDRLSATTRDFPSCSMPFTTPTTFTGCCSGGLSAPMKAADCYHCPSGEPLPTCSRAESRCRCTNQGWSTAEIHKKLNRAMTEKEEYLKLTHGATTIALQWRLNKHSALFTVHISTTPPWYSAADH